MAALEIKGMKIGEGLPKTIISLMDPTVEETIETIKAGIEVGVDAFEWRGDFAADLHDPAQMATNSKLIAAATPNNPLLFTMRTIEAGGQATLPVDEYVALNKAIIEAGAIDMVDIDIELGEESTMELVAFAKEHQVATVISYHNFRGTPSVEWMVDLMCRMHNLGADIPKIATMALCPEDTLRLLQATYEVSKLHHDGPLLTMAMGRDGSLSRLTGEMCGSSLTFCALKAASAPGQVDVRQAKRIMQELHEVIS